MSGGLALMAFSIRRIRLLVVVMATILASFQILLNLAASVIHQSNAFGQLLNIVPDFLRQVLGPSIIALLSFGGIVCLGYFHTVIVGALVGLIIALGTEPAGEIESRFMDLIMAHSIPRHWIVTRSLLMIIGCTIFVLAAMIFGSWVGLYWLAPAEVLQPTLRSVGFIVCNLGALMLSWGGITLAITSVTRRRAIPAAVAGLLALASYLVDYLARFWNPARSVNWLCPFHYFNALDLVSSGTLPRRDICVLGVVAASGICLAYLLFERRDL